MNKEVKTERRVTILSSCSWMLQVELTDYGMNSVTQGIDALAIVRVVIKPVGEVKPGITPQVSLLSLPSIRLE